MPQYLYQVAYTSESLAAQIKNPQDRLEVVSKQIPHHLVGEEQHAAVGMVNDEKLPRAEQLVGDDQGAEGIIAGASSGVANDVGIAFREPRVLGRVQTGVHAGQNREVTRRW